jgi:hypothetical protein
MGNLMTWTVEGVGDTPALLLISCTKAPRSVQLDQQALGTYAFDEAEGFSPFAS